MSQGSWQEDSSGEARHRDMEQQLRLELAQKKLALAELAQQAERHADDAQAAQARCNWLELSLVHAHVPTAGAQQLLDAAHGTALQQSAKAQSAAQVNWYRPLIVCCAKSCHCMMKHCPAFKVVY